MPYKYTPAASSPPSSSPRRASSVTGLSGLSVPPPSSSTAARLASSSFVVFFWSCVDKLRANMRVVLVCLTVTVLLFSAVLLLRQRMKEIGKHRGAAEGSSADSSIDPSTLPRWDLERHFLYSSPFDSKIDDDISSVGQDCQAFQRKHKGNLIRNLPTAVKEYEALMEKMQKIDAYVSLSLSVKVNDAALTTRESDVKTRINELTSEYLTFFRLEIAGIPDEQLKMLMDTNEDLRHYESYLKDVRKNKPYYLSEEVEHALAVREPWASEAPVVDYLGRQLAGAKFVPTSDMKCGSVTTMNIEQVLNKLYSSDQSVRKAALKCLNEGISGNYIHRFAALALNVVCGRLHIENKERKFKTLRSSRNMSNDIPDEVVDALLHAVRTDGIAYAKRYYKLKKALLKATTDLKEFTWADRNAPLNLSSETKVYSWEEATAIVRSGYEKFSPTMAKLFERMIDEKRVDMPAVDGKRSGAFCHGVVPGVGPFQLNNYIGSKRDVTTLAHESGHGCHDILAYKQGYLQYHPPLTLAETASIFGEMIVFRDLLEKSSSQKERLAMLIGKIDEVINSVVRQCSFDRFEELVHTEKSKGTVADETFSKMWMQATKEYYGEEGEVIDKYDDMDHLWAYVSHFEEVPFYVYSYAFADLLVGSLYNVYMQSREGFESKFLELLEGGSTKDVVTALKPFSLDPTDSAFFKNALQSHLGSLLEEAETIAKNENLL